MWKEDMKYVLSALLLICFAQTNAICLAQQTVRLKGKIYATHFGSLLSDIEIRLLQDRRIVTTTRSDNDGNYQFNGLSVGKYELLIEGLGYVTKRFNIEIAEGEQKVLEIDVEVGHIENPTPHGLSISGRVRQTNGKPIQGARIVVVSPYNGNRMTDSQTDKEGKYEIAAMEGQFSVYAYEPGFKVECQTILLRVVSSQEQRRMNFVLEAIGSR